jgi:hypothetical protein
MKFTFFVQKVEKMEKCQNFVITNVTTNTFRIHVLKLCEKINP